MTLNSHSASAAFDRACTRWPQILLPKETFLARVTELAVDADRVGRHGDDLFLATAVLAGNPAAFQSFDAEFLTGASKMARRIDAAPSFVDDVAQELRLKLLTGPDPRLGKYAAAGSLLDWLRVAALRTAINLRRSDHLVVTEEFPFEEDLGDARNPPLDGLYQQDFQTALEAGFRRLGARERTLLRMHFVDHVNIDRMAVMYGVHRATVARWLVAIRHQLFGEAKAHLAMNHGFDTADVKSLYRHLEGRVHLTISRILRSNVAGP